MVTNDMRSLVAVAEGKEKATNPIRELFKILRKDKLPATWKTPIKDFVPAMWVLDFVRRLEHMHKMSQFTLRDYNSSHFWLGGLFTPEAFVAATRQAVAQAHTWSLETLYLKVTVNDATTGGDGFTFDGLTLYGSSWKDNSLAINNDVSTPLPSTRFTWHRREKSVDQEEEEERKRGEYFATIPVYLDPSRSTFLFSVRLPRPNGIPLTVWSQRGTCIVVWTSPELLA